MSAICGIVNCSWASIYPIRPFCRRPLIEESDIRFSDNPVWRRTPPAPQARVVRFARRDLPRAVAAASDLGACFRGAFLPDRPRGLEALALTRLRRGGPPYNA